MIRPTALFLGLIVAAAATGCNKTETSNANQPTNTIVANAAPSANANVADNAPAANVPSPAAELTGYSLASPSDAYRTAFEARKKCDIPVLKRVMSEEMTAAMTARAANDPRGKRTFDESLKELCEMPEAPYGGIKDEKIVGDEGTVKYQDEHGDWQLMDFVRENGEWKLTMPRGRARLPALK